MIDCGIEAFSIGILIASVVLHLWIAECDATVLILLKQAVSVVIYISSLLLVVDSHAFSIIFKYLVTMPVLLFWLRFWEIFQRLQGAGWTKQHMKIGSMITQNVKLS